MTVVAVAFQSQATASQNPVGGLRSSLSLELIPVRKKRKRAVITRVLALTMLRRNYTVVSL